MERLRGKKLRQRKEPEDVAFRRVRESLSAETVLEILAQVLGVGQEEVGKRRRNSALRAVAARYLVRYAGLRQRQIAKLLGMDTGGAISAQLARLPELIRTDRRLERKLRTIEDRLNEKRGEAG